MKHARIPRHLWSLGCAGALALAVALGPESGSRAGAQPAPPPPPQPNATLTSIPANSPTALPSGVPVPTAEPSAGPPTAAPSTAPAPRRRGRHAGSSAPAGPSTPAPEPTATPTSPAFATLDGTWEVQLQYIDRTEYSYLSLVQATGGTLSGVWHMSGKNAPRYPITGTYDGRLIRLNAVEPVGPVAFNGYVEGASDMIGLVTFGASAAAAATTPSPAAPVAPLAANDGVAFTAEHRGAPNRSILKR